MKAEKLAVREGYGKVEAHGSLPPKKANEVLRRKTLGRRKRSGPRWGKIQTKKARLWGENSLNSNGERTVHEQETLRKEQLGN